MKKLLFALTLAVLVSASASAQDGKNIYNKYSGKEGVESVYISPSMFRMMGELPEFSVPVGSDSIDLAPIMRSLEGMYLVNSSNADVNARIGGDISEFVQKNKFELLMDVMDGEEKVSMYTLPDKKDTDFLNGFLLFVTEPSECTFIYIAGTMSRKDFDALVSAAMK